MRASGKRGGSNAAPFSFLITCAACTVHQTNQGAVVIVKALKSFRGRYGLIRAGSTFECEPGYVTALLKNKMVEVLEGEAAPAGEPGPKKNRNIPTAPNKSGKERPSGQGGKSDGSGQSPAGGKGSTSSSLQADLASRKTTSTRSAGGVTSKSIAKKKKTKTRVVLDPAAPPAGE